MKIRSAAAVALFATMLFGSNASLAQDECVSSGNHTIQVNVGQDGNPVLSYRGGSAEEVRVCIGDQVQWVLNGPDRSYFVDFFNGAPIDGARRLGSNNNVIKITIGGNARRGDSYEYDVKFADGGGIDPRIVVG